jgi:hypothetical protein
MGDVVDLNGRSLGWCPAWPTSWWASSADRHQFAARRFASVYAPRQLQRIGPGEPVSPILRIPSSPDRC